ncbi:MAG: S1 RNA-binding domain-containing protein [Firmicutes bacterium]|nr:S1 RNA-binding domain-containing protein [Bacillota bacterium]
MNGIQYLPEGYLTGTAANAAYLSDMAGLVRAAEDGAVVEATAVKCDANMNLTVPLGEIDGIIERSELMLTEGDREVRDIAAITRVGKAVCFKIKKFTQRGKKTVALLSRRDAQIECREKYLSKLRPGDVIEAKVTHLEPFGAFVDIGCGVVSLLSIDCISVSRISHSSDRFKPGDRIKVVVKSIGRDGEAPGRIYVTRKELLGTWEENAAAFRAGQTVAGIVRSVESYGIFVELAPNLAGLAEYRDGIEPGQTAAVYIKSIIPERMKVKLVLIDTFRGETALSRPLPELPDPGNHISVWRYSPECAPKLIETRFD